MNIQKLLLLALLVFGLVPNTINTGAYCIGGQCSLGDPYAPCDQTFARQMENEDLMRSSSSSCALCNKQSVLSLDEEDLSDEYTALADESDENENDASDEDIDVYIIEYKKEGSIE
jgi:hypothetical protein